MSPTDDARSTLRLVRPSPRDRPVRSPFTKGMKQLLSSPVYLLFREIVEKNPKVAAETMRDAPECVGFAARMLFDPELTVDVGAAFLCAVEMGVDISSAKPGLKSALQSDGNEHLRLIAAKVFHQLAVHGHDISDAYPFLKSAYAGDSHENVRLTAEMALIAAGRRPE